MTRGEQAEQTMMMIAAYAGANIRQASTLEEGLNNVLESGAHVSPEVRVAISDTRKALAKAAANLGKIADRLSPFIYDQSDGYERI